MKTKLFSEPMVNIMLFGENMILMSSFIGDSSSSGTSRTPVNPISDGGDFNW